MSSFDTQRTISADLNAVRLQLSQYTVSGLAVLDVSTISGRTSGVRFERPTLGVRQFHPTEIHIKLRYVLDDPPTAHLAVYVCRGRAEHLCFFRRRRFEHPRSHNGAFFDKESLCP